MGREIRRVPPNWDHPKKERYDHLLYRFETTYRPMYDQSADEAWQDWQAAFQAWLDGEHDATIAKYGEAEYPKDQPYTAFCTWHGQPPDLEYYRPHWKPEDCTWWQVYETVSEGTPVTPPFATPEELVDYLVANGDFWDQKRREEGNSIMNCDPWPREQAERFVKAGWAPSLIMDSKGIRSGVEGLCDHTPKEQQ